MSILNLNELIPSIALLCADEIIHVSLYIVNLSG